MQRVDYTDLEYEVIGLKAAIDAIDAMVNRELLNFVGPSDKTVAYFQDDPHQKLFYILLADFLSEKTEASLIRGNVSCMGQLGNIVQNPSLEIDGSCTVLREAHETTTKWLSKKADITIWASSLDVELTLSLSRQDVINFAANMSKHHFGHLTGIINKINEQLDDGSRPQHDIIPALESIYFELYTNRLNYLGSAVVEMLNNIRWGVYDYLLPEFNRSYRKLDGVMYEFDIPQDIKTDFARSCYWALMNSVRSKPYVNRFQADEMLKLRY